jgi:hypothetical protein
MPRPSEGGGGRRDGRSAHWPSEQTVDPRTGAIPGGRAASCAERLHDAGHEPIAKFCDGSVRKDATVDGLHDVAGIGRDGCRVAAELVSCEEAAESQTSFSSRSGMNSGNRSRRAE